jgi:hypothetical protein
MQNKLTAQQMHASRSDSSTQNLQAELAASEEQVRHLQLALTDSQAERKDKEIELARINNELIVQQKIAEQTGKRNKKFTRELADADRQIDSQHTIALDLAASQKKLEEELETANNRIANLEKSLKTAQRPAVEPDMRLAISTPAPLKPIPVPIAQKPSTPKPLKPEPEKPTTASEPPAQPTEKTELPDVTAIDPFIHSWANAWSRKNVEDYLAHYSNKFKPSKGMSLAAWQKQRHQRLGKPKFIKIEVKNIKKKAITNSRVQVTFNQKYQSNTYGDRVLKTLELQWRKNGWMIVKETSKAL